MTQRFIGYHGTTHDAIESIEQDGKYNPSKNDNEWLGEGIYFFIELEGGDCPKNNALKWAEKWNKGSQIGYIENEIVIPDDQILDVDTKKGREMFREISDLLDEIISNEKFEEVKGLKIAAKDRRTMECFRYNYIAVNFEVDAFISNKSINFDGNRTASFIDNCRMLCVRDNKYIMSKEYYKC